MARVIATLLFALLCSAQDFQKECMACHKKKGIDLKKIYFDYLLEYSSKRATIKAMREYLLNPDPSKQLYIDAKPYRHEIDKKRLGKLLEIYWDRYTVIGKIR